MGNFPKILFPSAASLACVVIAAFLAAACTTYQAPPSSLALPGPGETERGEHWPRSDGP